MIRYDLLEHGNRVKCFRETHSPVRRVKVRHVKRDKNDRIRFSLHFYTYQTFVLVVDQRSHYMIKFRRPSNTNTPMWATRKHTATDSVFHTRVCNVLCAKFRHDRQLLLLKPQLLAKPDPAISFYTRFVEY